MFRRNIKTKTLILAILTIALCLYCCGCIKGNARQDINVGEDVNTSIEYQNSDVSINNSDITNETNNPANFSELEPPSETLVVTPEETIEGLEHDADIVEDELPQNIETTPVVDTDLNSTVETTPQITFLEVNETVYARSDVNVRSGPGTNYDKIGSLSTEDVATRIGIGSNGWSKIIYQGKEAYASSNYLTTSKPEKQESVTPSKFAPTGSYAIPDFSIYNEDEKAILKTVLDKIHENKNNLEIHEEMIEFDHDISFQSYYKIASFFYVYYGQKRAVDETFDFVRNTSNEGFHCYIRLRYDDIRQFENDMVVIRNKVDNILSGFNDGDEEYILKQISEYLRKNITYTYGKYSLQNALLEGQSVCNGYALAFNILANRAGIKSDLCIGKASNGEYHAWNRVTLSDGSQYFYDITWYDGNSGPDNRYIHSKINFHGSYLINDYNACWNG